MAESQSKRNTENFLNTLSNRKGTGIKVTQAASETEETETEEPTQSSERDGSDIPQPDPPPPQRINGQIYQAYWDQQLFDWVWPDEVKEHEKAKKAKADDKEAKKAEKAEKKAEREQKKADKEAEKVRKAAGKASTKPKPGGALANLLAKGKKAPAGEAPEAPASEEIETPAAAPSDTEVSQMQAGAGLDQALHHLLEEFVEAVANRVMEKLDD